MLHNALLSAGSGLLLALMLEEVSPPLYSNSDVCSRRNIPRSPGRPDRVQPRCLLLHLPHERVDEELGDVLHRQLLCECLSPPFLTALS